MTRDDGSSDFVRRKAPKQYMCCPICLHFLFRYFWNIVGIQRVCNVFGTFLFGSQLWLCLNVAWNQPTAKAHCPAVRVVMC